MKKTVVLLLVLAICVFNAAASDYSLNSVSGIWSSATGGDSVTGINTNEIRWGTPAYGGQKSGLEFDSTGAQSFNEGDEFKLGTLTHYNYPITDDAPSNAALKIGISFASPAVSPDPDFTFTFAIQETDNTRNLDGCPSFQESGTPCDDRITFPDNYGEESYQIGDKLYTLKITGFVDSFPGGSPVSEFITEENEANSAFLVGTLSSVLIDAPQITLVSKTTNGDSAESAPGPSVYVGDAVNWEYLVQNTGNVPLSDIVVTDDKVASVECPYTVLAAGDSMTCTATGVATLGQYENKAKVTGKYNSIVHESNERTSHYLGVERDTSFCGDSQVDSDEQCDSGDANGEECTPVYDGSCQFCNDNCEFVTLNGGNCGDGIVNAPYEQCDGTNDCTEGCTFIGAEPYCGDGVVNQPSEECDGTDNCTAECTLKGDNEIPEFTTIGFGIALIGAGIIASRRRKD